MAKIIGKKKGLRPNDEDKCGNNFWECAVLLNILWGNEWWCRKWTKWGEKMVGGRSIVLHNIIAICNDKHFPFCSILVEKHVEVDVCTNFAEDDWKEISNEKMAGGWMWRGDGINVSFKKGKAILIKYLYF